MHLFDKEQDTIAAIATPVGRGGIGIVRLSGNKSLAILRSIFRPSNPHCSYKSHTLFHGFIFDPETGTEIDEALCVYMKAPKTYTREDVVELQCHSGPAVLRQILDLCLRCGARLAEPGEFTKRAFLSGRIHLSQAEALKDVVDAQASGMSLMSVKGLKGDLEDRFSAVRDGLLHCISALEVAIDYPEDEGEILDQEDVKKVLEEQVIGPVSRLISSFENTQVFRTGARVILVGRPNAGKSSLLNALCGEERAIVTEVPGTTRDVIEKNIELQGIPIILTDTAGIRHSPDPIEAMGMERIRKLAHEADMFLWLLDPTQGTGREEREVANLLLAFGDKKVILVINKMDTLDEKIRKNISERLIKGLSGMMKVSDLKTLDPCLISAKTGQGLQQLCERIVKGLLGDRKAKDVDVAPNLRQKEVLKKVLDHARSAKRALGKGLSPEIVAIDLRQALDELGKVTGETVTEDILDRIFSQFCLGK